MASAQVAELVIAAVVAAATRNMRLPKGWPGWQAAIAGAAGAAGAILYFYATHDGFLAVTAVLTSLYPASTIVLARTLLGERLTRLRLAGLGLAGVTSANSHHGSRHDRGFPVRKPWLSPALLAGQGTDIGTW